MIAFNKTWLMTIALCASTLHADLPVNLQIGRQVAGDSYSIVLQPQSKDRSLFQAAKKGTLLPQDPFTQALMPKGASFLFDSKKVVPDKTGGVSYDVSYNKMITNLTKEQCEALAAARELSMMTRVTQLVQKPSPEVIKQSLTDALLTFSKESRSLLIKPLANPRTKSKPGQEDRPPGSAELGMTTPIDISVDIEEASVYKPMVEPAYMLIKDFVQALGISMRSVNEQPWHKRHRGKLVAGGGLAATALTLWYLSKQNSAPNLNVPAATPSSSLSFTQGITSAASSYLKSAKSYIGDWLGGYIAKHVVERASANYQANPSPPGLLQNAQQKVIGAGVQKALKFGVSDSFKNWTP